MRLPVENQERAPVIAAGIFRVHDVDGAGKRIQTGGSAVADDGDDDVLGHALVGAAQQRTDKRSLVGRWFQDARVLLSGALPGQRNERAEMTKKSPRTRAGAGESAIGGRPHGRRDVRAMRLPCGRCRLQGHQRAKRADSGFQGFPRMEWSGHFCYPPPPPAWVRPVAGACAGRNVGGQPACGRMVVLLRCVGDADAKVTPLTGVCGDQCGRNAEATKFHIALLNNRRTIPVS